LRPLALLSLPLFLAGCETMRYPTPEEMFEGQAILSINFGSRDSYTSYRDYPRLSEHLERLQTPVNLKRDLPICQIPTTDAIVEAVNDLVRTGRPLAKDTLTTTDDSCYFRGYHCWPSGTYLPDIVSVLLIDTDGRSVTLGEISRDFDGNFFNLPPIFEYPYFLSPALGRVLASVTDLDDVFKKCVEYGVIFDNLSPL
jgi:hypothetical protein